MGGIPRIVSPNENGWLTAPGDKAALVNIFTEIKNNIPVLENYGKRSFEIVQDYSPEKVNEKLSMIYEDLLSSQILSANRYNYEKGKHS